MELSLMGALCLSETALLIFCLEYVCYFNWPIIHNFAFWLIGGNHNEPTVIMNRRWCWCWRRRRL